MTAKPSPYSDGLGPVTLLCHVFGLRLLRRRIYRGQPKQLRRLRLLHPHHKFRRRGVEEHHSLPHPTRAVILRRERGKHLLRRERSAREGPD